MKFNFENKDVFKYSSLTLALIGAFWAITILEVLLTKTNDFSISLKLINDFWCGLILSVVVFPIYLIIHYFAKKRALLAVKILFVLFIIIQFSLVKYSLTTLLNLGADLLGYSLDDIFNTVTASESFSITYFLPFIIFPVLFILLNKFIKKYLSKKFVTGGSAILFVLFGCIKLIASNASATINQNKISFLTNDIIKFQKEKNRLNAFVFNRNDYPLLKHFSKTQDVLSPFFNVSEEKPNIVVLIVEGLGTEFVGDKAYAGFTPYLDKLISKSLYWENFVSNSGRTFGVIPSLLASLPLGETGFLELPKIPTHVSLISALKANGYSTSYYSGDQSSFDKKINFLEYNEIDNIIDENKFGPEYVKTKSNSGGFSWGYPDSEIYRKTLASLDEKKQPRLDIIMSLSNHEPFTFPLKEQYELKVDSILNSGRTFGISKEDILEHKDIYTSLYYTDQSIKNLIDGYAKRSDFKNTIFIITGDHRLIPISQKDKLCRYHVPLYIYSPMLKSPERFKSVSSHWDVTPSLLSYLKHNYKFNNLNETAWMSTGLDTARQFRNIHKIALTRYKGSINDFIYKDYLLSDGKLYKINEDFGTYLVHEKELAKTISDSFIAFKNLNAYVTQHNKIFPDSLNNYLKPRVKFTKQQLATIASLTKDLSIDQAYKLAREKAFNKKRKEAQLLCDYILNELPNHSDARTLKGRTLAWDGDYPKSEIELLNVKKRAPYYDDCYLALLDMYWWSAQETKSELIYQQALKNKIQNPEIGFKMAKAYSRMKNYKRAKFVLDSLIKIHPNNTDYMSFKKTLP
jgi:lipoteichoic acid synthase